MAARGLDPASLSGRNILTSLLLLGVPELSMTISMTNTVQDLGTATTSLSRETALENLGVNNDSWLQEAGRGC